MIYQLNRATSDRQVICFPYLGGYANAFLKLAYTLEGSVELWAANPPGHGGSRMQLVSDIDVLIERYAEEVKKIIKPGCVFFGHSMGGTIAYYLTKRLMESGGKETCPKAVIISACGAPTSIRGVRYSNLPDDELIEQLTSYGAMPKEVLAEDDFIKMLTPVFRADYRILESASRKDPSPLEVPTYLLWGEKDSAVSLDAILQWKKYFKNSPIIWPIKGGDHMFVHSCVSEVAKCVEFSCAG